MKLTEEQKKTFKSIILLDAMINNDRQFSTDVNSDDMLLAPLLKELMAQGYVIFTGGHYKVSSSGRDVLVTFNKRYAEYLKIYDIYAFVDLDKGEFAFSSYFDFDSDQAWDDFKNEDRFEDLRITVALFKKMDPAEIVFMAFINENRFDTGISGWQKDLLGDAVWQEIEEIADTAIKSEELGADAMEDMVNQGSAILRDLLEQEEARRRDEQNNQNDINYTEEVIIEEETVAYYQPYYYDPYYVSPVWYLPWFLG
jgi:hypothetical protein